MWHFFARMVHKIYMRYENDRVYDGVEAETTKSQANFQMI